MTDDEFNAVCGVVEDLFVGDLDNDKRRSWRLVLDSYNPTALLGAAVTLAQQGQKFIPSVGEVCAAANEQIDPAVPAWDEVWRLIQRAMNKAGRTAGSDAAKTAAGAAWLHEHDQPIVAAFFELKTYAVLGYTEFWDPDYGALRLRELAQSWEQFVGVAQERLRAGRTLATMERRAIGPVRFDQEVLLRGLRPESDQAALGAGGE